MSAAVRYSLAGPATLTQEIRNSRFIAHAAPCATPRDALEWLLRQRIADASHNCWAYRVGQQYRFNDDGEPGGTAGKPILAAIDGQGLDQVVVRVARYFGGIKLGSGGLMRAYGGCAAACLRRAESVAVIERIGATLRCDFAALTLLQARLREFSVVILAEAFDGAGVVLQLDIPCSQVESVQRLLGAATRGRSSLQLRRPDTP